MIMRRGGMVLVLVLLFSFGLVAAQSFDVSSLLLKVSVKSGDSLQKEVNINARSSGDYVASIVGLEGVSVSDSEFFLNEGESKGIQVSFNSLGLEPGVRVGSLRVSGPGGEISVPLVFEIESRDLFFDINLNIPPQYNDVEPGGRLVAQLKIFDLVSGGVGNGLGATTVNVEYLIINLDGEVVSSEQESVVVEGQTQISKTINFPESIETGNYVFVAVARYASSVGTSSFIFNIKERGLLIQDVGFGERDIDLNFLSAVAALLIFFFGLVIVFVYLLRDRDKTLVGLRRYHDWETRRHSELLKEQIKKASKIKGARPVRIRAEARKRVEKLRAKQKRREREFARLRKLGDTKIMERKLREWRKEGYSTLGLRRDIKSLKKAKKARK